VILKLNKKRTIQEYSPFSSGSLVKFIMSSLFDKAAIKMYDKAIDMNIMATRTSCESTKNSKIDDTKAIITM
jgi:hypothetical protein